jgi:hypothetical protein
LEVLVFIESPLLWMSHVRDGDSSGLLFTSAFYCSLYSLHYTTKLNKMETETRRDCKNRPRRGELSHHEAHYIIGLMGVHHGNDHVSDEEGLNTLCIDSLYGMHGFNTLCIDSLSLCVIGVADMRRRHCSREFKYLIIKDAPCLEILIVLGRLVHTSVSSRAHKLTLLGFLPDKSSQVLIGDIAVQVDHSYISSF